MFYPLARGLTYHYQTIIFIYMAKTIIQIPVDKTLRDQATRAALSEGFSSLQELMRIFLHRLVNKQVVLRFEEPPIQISPRAGRRYDKMIDDIDSGRVKTKSFTSVSALMKDLTS